jgi:oxygen-dependent protoporphyrinogen oxidase
MKRVVIIGGGISGLGAAWSLREHQHQDHEDFEVVVIEGKERVGGNIRTELIDGFLIEGGPDCFISEKPWAMELCKRIGLGDALLATNSEFQKTFVLSGGVLHELPEGVILMVPTKILPLAFSSLITMRGKLRMALEYFVPRRSESSEEESLGDFVRRRLGKEVLEKIAEPLIAGIHAGDPETMSVKSSFPKFVEMEQEYGSLIKGMLKRMARLKKNGPGRAKGEAAASGKRVTMFMTLKGGLSDLVDELAGRLTGTNHTRIMTGLKVTGVSAEGPGYRVAFDGNSGDSAGSAITADAVIVAAPAYAAAALLEVLDAELAERLKTIPYASTATISVAFKRSDVTHPLNGFGFVVPGVEGRRIMAATWTSVKFSHRAPSGSVLIRCFVGGARNAGLITLPDEELVAIVREELEDIMGIEAPPVLSRVFRWVNSMPQYTIGHEERVGWITERVATHPGLYLTGSAYHGIGIADSVRYGEVVAKKALHYIKG